MRIFGAPAGRLALLTGLLGLSATALWFRGDLQARAYGLDDGERLRGRPAPELPREAKTPDGRSLRLVDVRGRVVLLHFWTFG